MKHVITHDLALPLARAATRRALETYAQRFVHLAPTGRWVDEDRAEVGFKAAGVQLQGLLQLRPGEIEIELEVPFLFRALRGKAVAAIELEVQTWLERARNGEIVESANVSGEGSSST